MRVARADGGEERQVVVQVHPLAAVLWVVRVEGVGWRSQRGQWQRAHTHMRTTHAEPHPPRTHPPTSLPMAIQLSAQGSGWPMAARREPHSLSGGPEMNSMLSRASCKGRELVCVE